MQRGDTVRHLRSGMVDTIIYIDHMKFGLMTKGGLQGSIQEFDLVQEEMFPVATKASNPKEAVGSTRVPLHIIPDGPLAWLSMAFYEGATKYGSYNWRVAGVRAGTYVAACRRHLSKWWNGEQCDPKTKVHHLANATACLVILLDAEIQGMLTDDRPPKQDLEDLYASLATVQEHLTKMHAHLNPTHHTEKSV